MGIVMKSYKVALISLLLSLSTLGSVYTQSPPQLSASFASGISPNGLPFQLGIRGGLGHHFSVNGNIGSAPWRFRDRLNRQIATNVTLLDLKIKGQLSYGLDLRAFTLPNQSGFYFGAGLFQQQVKIESKTELRTPRSSVGFAQNARTGIGFLLGGLVDIITGIDGKQKIEKVDRAVISGVSLHAGYAHVLKDQSRIEFGLSYLDRNSNSAEYSIPTFDQPKVFNINDKVKPKQLTAEFRYIIPIL